jgi:DHA2 family multidrug resistance protein
LSPFDPSYQIARERIGDVLTQKGLPPIGADGLLYRELIRQSTTLAFADAFLIICLLILCMLPLVFLMQRSSAQTGPPPPAH